MKFKLFFGNIAFPLASVLQRYRTASTLFFWTSNIKNGRLRFHRKAINSDVDVLKFVWNTPFPE